MSKFARLVNAHEALTAFKAKYHIPNDVALSIVIRIPQPTKGYQGPFLSF